MSSRLPIILMADDDEDDRLLTAEAFAEGGLGNELRFVEDGQALLDYLAGSPPYADAEAHPRPSLILLDLNMPRMDGREALKRIKADPSLCTIPVVVMTASRVEEDILRSYDVGAAGFVVKPVTLPALVGVLQSLQRYWFNIVERPS